MNIEINEKQAEIILSMHGLAGREGFRELPAEILAALETGFPNLRRKDYYRAFCYSKLRTKQIADPRVRLQDINRRFGVVGRLHMVFFRQSGKEYEVLYEDGTTGCFEERELEFIEDDLENNRA